MVTAKTSEILRDVLRQVVASPHPTDHRTWPSGSGTRGVTKAEVIARLEGDIAYFAADEDAS